MSDTERKAQLGAVGDGLARGGLSLARRFAAGFDVIVIAARQLRARPALALAVVALATASWFSSATVTGIMTARRFASAGQPVPSIERSRLTFPQRWAAGYQGRPWFALLWWPLPQFESPLRLPSSIANRWMVLAYYPVLVRRLDAPAGSAPPGTRPRQSARATGRDQHATGWVIRVYPVAISVPAALVSALIWVGLLGWVRDKENPVRLADLPGYWRRHYWAVLAVALIGVALAAVIFPVLNQLAGLAARSEPSALSDIARTIYSFASPAVMPILGLLFMFAPFVIVARGAGWWKGIVEGLRLWRRQWPAVIAMFIVFRVGWEVIVVWDALCPWETWRSIPYRVFRLSSPPLLLVWSWVGTAGLALLGLWVAYTFMEIARAPQPAQAEDTAQA